MPQSACTLSDLSQDTMAIRSNALASLTPTSTPVAPGYIAAYAPTPSYCYLSSHIASHRNMPEVVIAPGPGAPVPSSSPMLKSLTGISLVQHHNAHD